MTILSVSAIVFRFTSRVAVSQSRNDGRWIGEQAVGTVLVYQGVPEQENQILKNLLFSLIKIKNSAMLF